MAANTLGAHEMKHLPIGINTLSTIIENHCVYIDKTPLIHQMVQILFTGTTR